MLRARAIARWLAPALAVGVAAGGCAKVDPQEQRIVRIERRIADAAAVQARDFPPAAGRTLQQIADTTDSGPQVAFATATLTPGTNRLAFALAGEGGGFTFGRSAVYVAGTPGEPARGPFPAPADSLTLSPRSDADALGERDRVPALYEAKVPLPLAGRYAVLVATKASGDLVGATSEIRVAGATPVPARGDRAPAGSGDDLGRRPVALLFDSPGVCRPTAVCGPSTELAREAVRPYGDRVAFVREDLYQGGDVTRIDDAARAFGLTSGPWLFTIDRRGRIAARLEGAFGRRELRRAVDAALRPPPP